MCVHLYFLLVRSKSEYQTNKNPKNVLKKNELGRRKKSHSCTEKSNYTYFNSSYGNCSHDNNNHSHNDNYAHDNNYSHHNNSYSHYFNILCGIRGDCWERILIIMSSSNLRCSCEEINTVVKNVLLFYFVLFYITLCHFALFYSNLFYFCFRIYV